MQWSWRIGRIAQTEIHIHVSFSLVFVYLWSVRPPQTMQDAILDLLLVGLLFSCVTFHELGHVLAARRAGLEVLRIVLWPFGGLALFDRSPRGPIHELAVAAAGPLVNLLIVGLVAGMAFSSELLSLSSTTRLMGLISLDQLTSYLLMINLSMALLNLLPAYPLDGGRIAKALLTFAIGEARATRLLLPLSIALSVSLTCWALLQGDLPLAIVGGLVFLGASTLDNRVSSWMTGAHVYLAERGYWHLLHGRPLDAIRYYDQAIKRRPGMSRLHHNRAWAHLQRGDLRRSLVDYTRAIQLAPQNAKAYADRGVVYHRARMFDAAIEDYCRSLELEPGIDYVQERRAMARLWSGDPQGAIDDLTDLLHRSPESPGGYAIRGLAWLRQDEVALAVCDLDRSLELRSDHLETSLYRSQAHYALGDLQAAQQDAEQALKLSPKYALLHDEVCLMVSMRGQLAWALWFYSWAQQAGYDLLLVCEGRGDALRVNGHFREAIENYDRCLPGADDPAATYLSRGWAWQGLGEDDRAAADFQRVLELSDHPGLCENARESLAELASMTKAG